MFLKIQQGDHTINLNFISEVEWKEEYATVTMSNGNQYDFEEEDLEALKKFLGM